MIRQKFIHSCISRKLCNFISTPPADSQSWRGRRPTPAVCYLLRRPVLPPLLRPFAAFFPRSYRPRQPSLVDNSMSIERRRKASPIIGQRCGQRRPPLEIPSTAHRASTASNAASSAETEMSSPGMHKETKQQWASPSVQSDSPADFEIIGIWFGYILTGLSWFIVAITFPFSMCFCLKVVKEYERVVIFRLGRLMPGVARGPGLVFIMPCIDTYRKIDLRVVSYAVPPQEILSKDSVTVSVDAVVYFRTSDPIAAVNNVDDAIYSTKLLAQTTLRNALGMKTLTEMLCEREAIAQLTETILDEGTEHWGIKVERVEVKDIRLPQQLTRAMAAEAEAAREARAKVVAAEGEMKASRALKEAADVLADSPVAIQLRHLQALSSIAAEHNSTIVFPVPIDLFGSFMKKDK
ncbi:Protein unc-1 [Trichinella pseudospiralis]|uniref:Protein unc-1 n=1 Tax=Trichinella pseudospiralis TaxID=6337 RepID=A0A0V1EF86_TRIPS|nr:Protein unc-1 [Trichinella pseudospiralis]